MTLSQNTYEICGELLLFNRLYNWIKFKTLPSSVLFKNRLFVERDSKHRRVMSNFGLTFRNSKWSDYSIKNITLSSRVSFFRLLFNSFTILLFVTLSISICYYYNSQSQFNELTYQLWSFFDEAFYLFSFLFWILSYSITFIFKFLYDNIFNTFYHNTNKVNHQYSSSNDNKMGDTKFKPAKNLHSPLFLSWLNTNNNTSTSVALEELLTHNTPASNWGVYQRIFRNLYLSSYSLKTIDSTNNINHIENNKTVANLLINNEFNHHLISDNNSLDQVKGNFITNSNSLWNLNTFSSELSKYNNLILSKTGSFYLNDLNFNKLNQLITNSPELTSLTSSMINQTKVIKWNRWLYRYNVLHRKTVKNSHKLTMVKKLITTGFYDSSLTSNNIWASDFFSKNKQSTGLIHSQFNLLYKNTFNNNNSDSSLFNSIGLGSTNTPINMLQFYEKSYFWFVKRFYLFNTLGTNNISSDVVMSVNNPLVTSFDNKNKSSNMFSIILNSMLRSRSLTNSNLNPVYLNTELNRVQQYNNPTNTDLKDISILVSETDLLSIDNLELLLNLNSNVTSVHNSVSFFNVNSYVNNDLLNPNLTLNLKKTTLKGNLNSNYSSIDNNLLLDLYVLSVTNTTI